MMKQRSLLWWVILAVSLLASGLLLVRRAQAELASDRVCAVLSMEDLAPVVLASGLPESAWRDTLSEAGVTWQDPAHPTFAEVQGDDVPATDLPLALVENHDRTSVLLPEGFDLEAYDGPVVKTLYLYDDYADRVTGDDPKEIENLLFRAVTDRGLRLLILTPFTQADGTLVTDPQVYANCLTGLASRLESRGLTLGEDFSCLATQPLNPWFLLAAGLLPGLVGVELVCRVPVLKKGRTVLLVVMAAGVAGLCLWRPPLAQTLLMLGAAVVFPALAAWGIADYAAKPVTGKALLGPVLALLGWTLLGAASVSALMASRTYLLGQTIFSGVKVALLAPMALGCLLLLWTLRRDLLRAGLKGWLGLAAAAAVIAAMAFLLMTRSGDLSSAISGLETSLRNGLEEGLYARPRTKELLFAAPSIPLFLWACRARVPAAQLLFGAGTCLECVSVTNTFCHAVAPLHVSLIRTLLGAGLGILLGLAAVGLLHLLTRKR